MAKRKPDSLIRVGGPGRTKQVPGRRGLSSSARLFSAPYMTRTAKTGRTKRPGGGGRTVYKTHDVTPFGGGRVVRSALGPAGTVKRKTKGGARLIPREVFGKLRWR